MTYVRLIALAAFVAAAPSALAHDTPPAPDCECLACAAVPTTKKTTSYERQTKDSPKCYVKARFDLFRRLCHKPPAEPEVVPLRRRVLMKREVTKEKPAVKYEARTFTGTCAAHRREHCHACHGG
ncbi:hypothetical protein [Paludisphaera sp.]|uniref:hypothetical protein n=1 Tax=Paludisphaera sp. TaxID=2017432 RepID=UPI00301D2879